MKRKWAQQFQMSVSPYLQFFCIWKSPIVSLKLFPMHKEFTELDLLKELTWILYSVSSSGLWERGGIMASLISNVSMMSWLEMTAVCQSAELNYFNLTTTKQVIKFLILKHYFKLLHFSCTFWVRDKRKELYVCSTLLFDWLQTGRKYRTSPPETSIVPKGTNRFHIYPILV